MRTPWSRILLCAVLWPDFGPHAAVGGFARHEQAAVDEKEIFSARIRLWRAQGSQRKKGNGEQAGIMGELQPFACPANSIRAPCDEYRGASESHVSRVERLQIWRRQRAMAESGAKLTTVDEDEREEGICHFERAPPGNRSNRLASLFSEDCIISDACGLSYLFALKVCLPCRDAGGFF